ncbi:MAG: hypothetical protein P8181_01170 [bacterium]
MNDPILTSFLEQQEIEAMELDSASDLVDIHRIGPKPTQRYVVQFRCKSLVRTNTGINEANRVDVGIYFPPDYWHRVVPAEIITLLWPVGLWHSNVKFPFICPGRLIPGTSLVSEQLGPEKPAPVPFGPAAAAPTKREFSCDRCAAAGERQRTYGERTTGKRARGGCNVRVRSMDMKIRVGEALASHGFDVLETGPRTWRIGHDGTTPREVDVALSDRWLCLREPLPGTPDTGECRAYARAGLFSAGRGKVAIDPASGAAGFREELPMTDGIDLTRACGNVVSRFAVARTILCDPETFAAIGPLSCGSEEPAVGRPRGPAKQTTEECQGIREDLCAETDWECSRRGDGRPVVSLPLPYGTCHAAFESLPTGGYRIAAALNRFESPSATVHSAVAAYLLTANDLVRFARGLLDEWEGGLRAFMEVLFSERPSPVLFEEALCALSVGVRFCDRELKALGDERVARDYLSIRGWSPNG